MLRTVTYGVRFNSTAARQWMNVVVPSKPEKLKIPEKEKKKLYSPDLSYLRKAPQNSLAGRLAKPALHRERINRFTRNRTPESTTETKIDVAAITQRRREARLAREKLLAQNPQDIAFITQRRVEARIGRQVDETIRTVEDNADRLNSLVPSLDSPGPLPLAKSARHNVTIPDDELSPLALKRRQQRRLRERSPSQYLQPRKESSQFDDNVMEVKTDLPEIESAEFEEASPIAEAPEFNGPEPISEPLDDEFSAFVQYHPLANGHDSVDVSKSPSYRLNPNLIDSLVGGDYSQYTSLSSSINNSASPNGLTVVNTAELALTRQRDYIIPQRKQAINIVKNLVEGKFVQATKQSLART